MDRGQSGGAVVFVFGRARHNTSCQIITAWQRVGVRRERVRRGKPLTGGDTAEVHKPGAGDKLSRKQEALQLCRAVATDSYRCRSVDGRAARRCSRATLCAGHVAHDLAQRSLRIGRHVL